MKEQLKEDINRIKKLMLVEQDEQPTLFSTGTPINLNSTEFTKKFKEKVLQLFQENPYSIVLKSTLNMSPCVTVLTITSASKCVFNLSNKL